MARSFRLDSWPAFISITSRGLFRGARFKVIIFIRHGKPFRGASQCLLPAAQLAGVAAGEKSPHLAGAGDLR
jgi:hypothetical protein